MRIITVWIVMLALSLNLVEPSFAQSNAPALPIGALAGGGGGAPADDTCTSDFPDNTSGKKGLLTQIIEYVKEVIDKATQELYDGIIKNTAFLAAVNAAFALFIIVFGVAFMFGIVPLTFGQALVRLLKMAVILALIHEGFAFFNEYVIKLFNDGTDELIDTVIGIALGSSAPAATSSTGAPLPFTKLEGVVMQTLSPEMMVSIITTFTTGPMGLAMGGLLGIALMGFVMAIVKALRVYVISLVAKALLFGLAPIFVAFILFEKTKNIFTGWVNQIVNYSLQPLMMFAFLSFFFVLIESSVENILERDICWTTFEHMSGTTNHTQFWRFVDEDGNVTSDDFTWEGFVSCVQEGGACEFPINPIDVLTFLILAHLAWRFSDIVVNIATEIASSTLFLDKLRSGLSDMVSRSEGGVGNANSSGR